MNVGIVTLFPELVGQLAAHGVVGRALTTGPARLEAFNPRDWATDIHRTVDDRPYGGGPGMVMTVEPLRQAIAAARNWAPAGSPVIVMSPQGRRFDQARARELAALPGLVLVAGRYEGIDERILAEDADDEMSVGDYVLSGGELAAMVVTDAVVRLLPGALGDPGSAGQDSFEEGLLDHPHYTRPEVVGGARVPAVLLGGDHAAIRRWRLKQALGRTLERRPDLLTGRALTDEERQLLEEWLRERREADDNCD